MIPAYNNYLNQLHNATYMSIGLFKIFFAKEYDYMQNYFMWCNGSQFIDYAYKVYKHTHSIGFIINFPQMLYNCTWRVTSIYGTSYSTMPNYFPELTYIVQNFSFVSKIFT